MFRTRDILAIAAAVILTQMAWNDNLESLSATIHLAWYTPYPKRTMGLIFGERLVYGAAPMDVDGDGTMEAFAMITTTTLAESNHNHAQSKRPISKEEYVVQVLDLKPLHSRRRQGSSKDSSSSSSSVDPTRLGVPFRPEPLFTSEPLKFPSHPQQQGEASTDSAKNDVKPLQLVTGHVLIANQQQQHENMQKQNEEDEKKQQAYLQDERTRHYFCGKDWHDAATRCGKHCPGGSPSECGEDERCYADTPCDALSQAKPVEDQHRNVLFQLTPGGGLPSIMTLWSDGSVSLHSVTGDVTLSSSDQDKKNSRKNQLPPLELRLLWHTSALKTTSSSTTDNSTIVPSSWMESRLVFFDATTSSTPSGMVIVSGSIIGSRNGNIIGAIINFVTALDAKTGNILWQDDSHLSAGLKKTEATTLLPMDASRSRRTSSSARRRSNIPSITMLRATSPVDTIATPLTPHGAGSNSPNCLSMYRRSLLSATPWSRPEDMAFPYVLWGVEDTVLRAVHLDSQRRQQQEQPVAQPKQHGRKKMTPERKTATASDRKKQPWALQRRRQQTQPQALLGRPNVLVQHAGNSMQLRSLKNGRSFCHLSLMDHTLYADLNQDGTLDQVRILTEDHQTFLNPYVEKNKDQFVQDLWQRISGTTADANQRQKLQQQLQAPNRLCHVMALSGMPAKEELFDAPLCGSNNALHERVGDNPNAAVHSAPPLLVESLDYGYGGSNKGYDVVIALNNGLVHRFRSTSPGAGNHLWQFHGHSHHNSEMDVPTWTDTTQSHVQLGRIDTAKTAGAPWNRPILLVGDNAMSILSARQGTLLASASFPQTIEARPILADVSGDGTTDVIIVTNDAIWGYQVIVRPGASIIFRLMVGVVLMGILLALLRNRFGQRGDKRSTDE